MFSSFAFPSFPSPPNKKSSSLETEEDHAYGSHILLSFKACVALLELAPEIGCRGFIGPVPPPLWIRDGTIFEFESNLIIAHPPRQPGIAEYPAVPDAYFWPDGASAHNKLRKCV
jgi:hypothetical protein